MSSLLRRFGAALALACAACGTSMPLTIPEYKLAPPAPRKTPEPRSVVPRLVPYAGLEVSYVANTEGDVYGYRGLYYTYFDGSWFCAQSLAGPWNFIEMKYVPSDLFRVRGHRPPSAQ
jgi:hypothetical protein